MNRYDYIYCEECKMFVDFWKYDYTIQNTGHLGHKWRFVTPAELEICIQDCEESGCFDELVKGSEKNMNWTNWERR